MKTITKPKYTFVVSARPAELGGGWQLKLLEDDLEVGGGVYPDRGEAWSVDAYNDAVEFGQNWLNTRPSDDTTIPQVAPEYVDVVDLPALRANGLPPAKEVFAQLAADAYPRTSLENVSDVLHAVAKARPHRAVSASAARPINFVQVTSSPDFIQSDLGNRRFWSLDLSTSSAADAAVIMSMTAAVQDVLAERQRQMSVEGWTLVRDDGYTDGSLARAAATYALGASLDGPERAVMDSHGSSGTVASVRNIWPQSWASNWFKPKSRRADLVKAGALILAEIERLDRATAKQGGAQ